MSDILCCENISLRYNNKAVIEDISLNLREGEMVSLIGSSGVGKSTLFHILSGNQKPDTGRVFLKGAEITGQAGQVGYMLQKDLLLPYKTIQDNVILPLLIQGQSKKEARAQALPFFSDFGLAGYEKAYPCQLSGGMRQRAALLRTYLQKSQVILLDEPFSALDPLTKMSLHSWYQNIIRQMKMSTIFITHDIDEALLLSHRIYILQGNPGKIKTEITLQTPFPRDSDYLTSDEFISYKRQILAEL